jgi:hypothetical protein
MHCTLIYYSGIKKTASPLNEPCMRLLKTIVAPRDAAIFLSSAANNFRHDDFSERMCAKCDKAPSIAYFSHAVVASGKRCMTIFFFVADAAIAPNPAARRGKTALKIFFGILCGICPARVDSERNRANRSKNDSGTLRSARCSEGRKCARRGRAARSCQVLRGRFPHSCALIGTKRTSRTLRCSNPKRSCVPPPRIVTRRLVQARSDERSARRVLKIRASSSAGRSPPAGSPCRPRPS